jgi:glycine betaine/proline transport system ATP-binding protein
MEQPPETLGAGQGPRTAHKLLRETQNSWLVVLRRDRTPAGVLWQDDVAEAVRVGQEQLPWSDEHEMAVVSHDTPVAELFGKSAQHAAPLVVVDDDGRFAGVIPRVTLLTALGVLGEGESPSPDPALPPPEAPDALTADDRRGGDAR